MASTSAPTVALPSARAGLEPFDPAFPELRADPYPVYHRYREREPVHWGVSGLAGYPGAWYLFRHADVVAALKDPRLGKARRQVNYEGEAQPAAAPPVPEAARPFMELARKFIVHRDPPDHTRIRNLLRGADFVTARLTALERNIDAASACGRRRGSGSAIRQIQRAAWNPEV